MGDSKLSAASRPVRPRLDGVDPPLLWPARGPAPNRHGAISRQLFTYSHYKTWAEKMRNSWKKEDDVAESVPPAR